MADEFEPTGEHSFEELDKLAQNGDLTEEALQAELAAYRTALEQEFRTTTDQAVTTGNLEKVEEVTRDFFKKQTAGSAANIVFLANNAHSETVRLAANKYIISEAFANASADGDPIKDLLDRLQKNKQSPAPQES